MRPVVRFLAQVGRIYIPSQEIDDVALSKPKGLKRQWRAAAAAAKEATQNAPEVCGHMTLLLQWQSAFSYPGSCIRLQRNDV